MRKPGGYCQQIGRLSAASFQACPIVGCETDYGENVMPFVVVGSGAFAGLAVR